MQQARSGVPASTQLTQAIAALRRLRSNGKSAAEQRQDQLAINVVISKLLRNSAGLSSVGHVDDDTGLDTGNAAAATGAGSGVDSGQPGGSNVVSATEGPETCVASQLPRIRSGMNSMLR